MYAKSSNYEKIFELNENGRISEYSATGSSFSSVRTYAHIRTTPAPSSEETKRTIRFLNLNVRDFESDRLVVVVTKITGMVTIFTGRSALFVRIACYS